MNKNIGNKDKLMRLIIGICLLFAALYFKSGFLAIFGIFSIFEAISGWCVFYQIIGRNTCPIKNKNENKIPFLSIFIVGISILIGAILLNILSNFLGFMNWYDLFLNFKNISNIKIDNLIFLFLIYPFALGYVAYFIYKYLNKS